MKDRSLKENSEPYPYKKSAPVDDLTSMGAEIILRGMILQKKIVQHVSLGQPTFCLQIQNQKSEGAAL